jgi:hypothetical protein
MKSLSASERSWLKTAGQLELNGFFAWPAAPLRKLEAAGLIERDPTTKGINTRWRITAKGSDLLAKESST